MSLQVRKNSPVAEIVIRGQGCDSGWIVAVLCSYNSEGIQFVEKVQFDKKQPWMGSNSQAFVSFSQLPEKVAFLKPSSPSYAFEIAIEVGHLKPSTSKVRARWLPFIHYSFPSGFLCAIILKNKDIPL
ncbi:MAG: hypothetical protein R6U27_11350 [Desulfobacterales bacterium]